MTNDSVNGAPVPVIYGTTRSNLRALSDTWPEVQGILNIGRVDTVIFVEKLFHELRLVLYRPEYSGEFAPRALYYPCLDPEAAREVVNKLGFSDFACDDKADPSEANAACITRTGFDQIIDATRNFALCRPLLTNTAADAKQQSAQTGNSTDWVDDPKWPEELDIALTAWRAARNNAEREGKRPGAYIREWLATNRSDLSEEARKRIATVANWDKTPGAAKK